MARHAPHQPRRQVAPPADAAAAGGVAWTFAAALAVCALLFGVRRSMRPLPLEPPPPRAIPAEIIYTAPNPSADHGTIAMVLCRYTINGRRYAGYARAPATAGPQPVEAIRAKFPTGGEVMIYASAGDPRKPSLNPPPQRSVARQARFGRFVLLLGCALVGGLIGLALRAEDSRRARRSRGSRVRDTLPTPVVDVYGLDTRRAVGVLIVGAAVIIAVGGTVRYLFA